VLSAHHRQKGVPMDVIIADANHSYGILSNHIQQKKSITPPAAV